MHVAVGLAIASQARKTQTRAEKIDAGGGRRQNTPCIGCAKRGNHTHLPVVHLIHKKFNTTKVLQHGNGVYVTHLEDVLA